jgi:adenylyl cyclase-associated protein
LVEKMYADQRSLILLASACKKPRQEELGTLLQPLHLDIENINKAKEIYRKDRDWQNHFTFVAEGAPTVGWVMVVRGSFLLCFVDAHRRAA